MKDRSRVEPSERKRVKPVLRFIVKPWEALSTAELYAILRLRIEVFVVEQNCPYQEADDKDQACRHVMGYDQDGELVAYARLVPRGISYDKYASIGRVINKEKIRRQGVGKLLMRRAIDEMSQLYPSEQVKISAQVYILDFYRSLGFETVGEGYMEDDIPHMGMILNKTKS